MSRSKKISLSNQYKIVCPFYPSTTFTLPDLFAVIIFLKAVTTLLNYFTCLAFQLEFKHSFAWKQGLIDLFTVLSSTFSKCLSKIFVGSDCVSQWVETTCLACASPWLFHLPLKIYIYITYATQQNIIQS
jgi:hypothetical protein